MTNNSMVKLSRAVEMLAECKNISDAKEIINIAAAAKKYAEEANLGRQAINHATEIKIRAERLFGIYSKDLKRDQTIGLKKGNTPLCQPEQRSEYAQVLEDVGATRKEALRCERLAAIPENEFISRLHSVVDKQEKLSSSTILSISSSAEYDGDEWYTPKEYIEAAREVMGSIDLDPASNTEAQKIVNAKNFYTKDDDGLNRSWRGNVFLNPPYSIQLIGQFTQKLIVEINNKNISQAILLVNNCTDTLWFHYLLDRINTICITKGRIQFWRTGQEKLATRQGQVFFYYGKNINGFISNFSKFGKILVAP